MFLADVEKIGISFRNRYVSHNKYILRNTESVYHILFITLDFIV